MRTIGLWIVCILDLLLRLESSGEEVLELSPYEVEGWRIEEAIERTGGVVTEIGEGHFSGGGAVSRVLRTVANIGLRSYNGGSGQSEVSLRGFGENSGLRVLVLMDGMKVNGPDMGGIDWRQLPASEIGFVEVIRGGQAVLYGQHALSGVIRIETKGPEGDGGGLRIGVGSDGLFEGDVWRGFAFGELGMRLGYSYSEVEGSRLNSSRSNQFGRLSISGGVFNGVNFVARITGGTGHWTYPGPLSYQDAIESPERSTNAGNQFSESDSLRHSFRFRGLPTWGEWELAGAAQRSEEQINLDGIHADRRVLGLKLAPRAKLGGEANFVMLGGELIGDELKLRRYTAEDRRIESGDADLTRLTLGTYSFAQRKLSNTLFASAGLRVERSETDYYNAVYDPDQLNPLDPLVWDPFRKNPKYKDPPDIVDSASFDERLVKSGTAWEVSFVYRPVTGTRVWIGVDGTYRYPVLDEVASYQGYTLSEPLNRDLSAETGLQYETGISTKRGDVAIDLAIFDLRMSDEIVYDETSGLNVNIGETRRTGLELSVTIPAGKWELGGHWQLVRSRLLSGPDRGRQIPLVAEHRGVLRMGYRPLEHVLLAMNVTYDSERFQGNDYANTGRVLPGYGLIGIRAHWEVSDHLAFSCVVENLLDKATISTAFNGSYYPGQPRVVELNLSWNY